MTVSACRILISLILVAFMTMSATRLVAAPEEVDATRLALARQVVDATGLWESVVSSAQESARLIVEEWRPHLGSLSESSVKKLEAEYGRRLALEYDAAMNELVRLYAATLTLEELQGILDFHFSPIGQSIERKRKELDLVFARTINQEVFFKSNEIWRQLFDEAMKEAYP